MDVVNADQAKIAEDAGAVAVMALERVPADIRRDGGVARMSDPVLIEGIQAAVTIPVMAKARIGHFAEAQVLEALGVDYIDESEVLTPADEEHHIDKWAFRVPFVCGATNLGEALRRISEGAAHDPFQGRGGHRQRRRGGPSSPLDPRRHPQAHDGRLRRALRLGEAAAGPDRARRRGGLDGAASGAAVLRGGLATPADAALVMQLGAEAVFVGSGIFKSSDPPRRARAIVEATAHFEVPAIVAKVSRGLGEAMRGDEIATLDVKLADRGW